MKITAIKQQAKRADRYSVFVDDKYSFSLSEGALLESKLVSGQELSKEQIGEFKQISAEDKLYNQALRYVAMRPRSVWEIEFYLERKKASPPLVKEILNKLSIIGLLDDKKLAKAFVNDRKLLRPTSRRKMIMELRKKHISQDVINEVIGSGDGDDEALATVIAKKRQQAKYQDDLKLMQYLARQGFNYDDIKQALGRR